jgi:hypothetical protein
MQHAAPAALDNLDAALVLSDAQQLVTSLTAEIRKLREERRQLRLSIDSVTDEALGFRAALQDAQEVARVETLRWEEQLANLNLLQTKEGDRGDRLQLLLRLTGLQRIQVEQDRDRLQRELDAERQRCKEQELSMKRQAILAQSRVEEAERLEKRQAKYIQTLESECRAQWDARVVEAQQRHRAEEELQQLWADVRVLQALGTGTGRGKGIGRNADAAEVKTETSGKRAARYNDSDKK